MRASERVPKVCIQNINGVDYIRVGGEDWSPNLIMRKDFDIRFADIADTPDFFAVLEAHPQTQTPGWQAGIKWMKAQALN